MTAPELDLAALLDAKLAPIKRQLDQLLEARQPKRILSKRQAMARLGIGKGSLQKLITSGQLQTVTVNGREKVAAQELERVAQQGFDVHQPRPKARRRAPPTPEVDDPAAGIRALKLVR